MLIALPFGIEIASGVPGFLLIVLLATLWGVVYAGFMQVTYLMETLRSLILSC